LKVKHFATAQEAKRKDVEHAFGVLQARFQIVCQPARLRDEATLQDIMETIQCMSPNDSPLAVLAQQGAEAAGPNRRMSEHDARWRITQNRVAWEYNREWDDLYNVIEDQRCLRLRTPSPPRRSLVDNVALVGKCGFRALMRPLSGLDWCWLRRFLASVLRVIYRKDARMSHEYQCNAWGAKSGKMHNLPILTSSSHLLLYP
jgi:hypothetical protein